MAIAYGPVETVNSGIKESTTEQSQGIMGNDMELPDLNTKTCAVCIRRIKVRYRWRSIRLQYL